MWSDRRVLAQIRVFISSPMHQTLLFRAIILHVRPTRKRKTAQKSRRPNYAVLRRPPVFSLIRFLFFHGPPDQINHNPNRDGDHAGGDDETHGNQVVNLIA